MIWTTLGDMIATAASAVGEGARSVAGAATDALSQIVETVRTVLAGDPETRRRVAFSIAMIALSAKMAKADGVVTHDEVAAFERIFEIPDEERRNVARLYDLAKQDVAGFEGYAMQLADLCDASAPNCPMLQDILDGLFHIAKADGVLHEAELDFLARIAAIFEIDEAHFEATLARHVVQGTGDPFTVLGLPPGSDVDTARRRHRQLVIEHHPDRAIARGMPEEFVAIANERLAAFNAAFDQIVAMNPERI